MWEGREWHCPQLRAARLWDSLRRAGVPCGSVILLYEISVTGHQLQHKGLCGDSASKRFITLELTILCNPVGSYAVPPHPALVVQHAHVPHAHVVCDLHPLCTRAL